MCYWLEALFSGPSLSLVVLFFFSLWLLFFLLVGILYIGSSTQIVFFFLILKLSFFLLLVFESVAKRPLLSNLIDYCTVTCCVFNVLAHITPRYMLERKLTWFLFHDSDSTWRPYFPLFFSVLDISTFKAREGEMESNLLLPFFFFLLRVLFICSTLLCFPPSFSARMRTQWQSDSMCLFSFFFFFEEFSCLSLRVHYIRSQTLPNNRTPPFFFVIILLHVLTYVSICVGYACFFFFREHEFY